jgi:pyruvate dehydrogenase E1 component alpha subunit/2-oxoisovalerate dehydrogenase E1 component alpha subunit
MAKRPAPEELPREFRLRMYHDLRLARAIDERAHLLHKQGKVVGGLFSNLGQEAVSIGTAHALRTGDYLGPMIRNLGALLVRGHSPREIFTQYLAKATSPTRGKDNSQHFGDLDRTGVVAYISMLGIQVSVLAGLALAAKLKGEPRAALAYIGDGAASTGDFYEGLNVASVHEVPLLVVIENNGWAYSTPTSRQSRLKRLSDRAAAFGIPGRTADGNDVEEVYSVAREEVEAARAGGGPRILELVTYRMRGHAPHDGQDYVPPPELEAWRKKDPVLRMERSLRPTAAERADVEARVAAAVEDAVAYAESSPDPDPADAAKGVFADDAIVQVPEWRGLHA